MEPILILLLVIAGLIVTVLILISWLGQALTHQRELTGRISHLESQIYQLELSMAGQNRYGPNQSGGWGWFLALGALIAFAAFVLLA